METTDLTSESYWTSPGIDFRIAPGLVEDEEPLLREIRRRGIESAVVLATSGSGGSPKLIVLEKRALLHSAKIVNQYCGIRKKDLSLAPLSTRHVGGIAIFARAFLSGSPVRVLRWDEWTRDGSALLKACLGEVAITSLTPVHLYDLVASGVAPPPQLRGVFVGGGALSRGLAERALDLGWPLWPTYGMTEASSQIATSLCADSDWLPILPHWETGATSEGVLRIRGESLFSGSFVKEDPTGQWVWNDATREDGFYVTGDRVELREGQIRPLGRADDLVKILGELVSPDEVETSLADFLRVRAAVVAIPDDRRGAVLVAVLECRDSSAIRKRIGEWNESVPGYRRVSSHLCLRELPRTAGGKIDRETVRERFQ